MVVRVVGINTAEAYFLVAAALADNDESGPLYVAEEDIENGLSGRVRKTAVLSLDTSAGSTSDPVYLSASVAGSISLTSSDEQIGWVGTVATEGVILVESNALGGGTSATVGNLYEQTASMSWGSAIASGSAASGSEVIEDGNLGLGLLIEGGTAVGRGDDGLYLAISGDAGGSTEVGWFIVSSATGNEVTRGADLPRLTFLWSASTLATVKHFIGLTEESIGGVTVLADDPTATYLGFQFSSNRSDTNWQLVHNVNGGTQTIVDTGVAAAVDTVMFFEFEYLTSTSVKFSLRDHTYTNVLYTLTTTVQPAATVPLHLGALSTWGGGAIEEVHRFYKANLLVKHRSAVT